MSLTQYENLARSHWKEFLPKRYKALKKAGELEAAVKGAAELTNREMTAALDSGVPRDQAWEQIRGRYLLIEPEPAEPEDVEDNPNLEALELSQQLNRDLQKHYDDLY